MLIYLFLNVFITTILDCHCDIVHKGGYGMHILRMDCVSVEYSKVLSRMQLSKVLMIVNDTSPKLIQTYMVSF